MRAINHALTGAIIGLTVSEPWVAAPAAVVSHFACDALPHYDSKLAHVSKTRWQRSRLFKNLLISDALLCTMLVLIFVLIRPQHWLQAATCAFLAAAPDFLWLPRFLASQAKKPLPENRFNKWASDIQWFTQPIGAVVEVAWFVGAIILIKPFLT